MPCEIDPLPPLRDTGASREGKSRASLSGEVALVEDESVRSKWSWSPGRAEIARWQGHRASRPRRTRPCCATRYGNLDPSQEGTLAV